MRQKIESYQISFERVYVSRGPFCSFNGIRKRKNVISLLGMLFIYVMKNGEERAPKLINWSCTFSPMKILVILRCGARFIATSTVIKFQVKYSYDYLPVQKSFVTVYVQLYFIRKLAIFIIFVREPNEKIWLTEKRENFVNSDKVARES